MVYPENEKSMKINKNQHCKLIAGWVLTVSASIFPNRKMSVLRVILYEFLRIPTTV
jgi:hypothetical protein